MHIRMLVCTLFCFVINILGQEYIKSFNSIVDVQSDGMLKVYEEITVVSAQNHIKRGIIRSFPTKYTLYDIFRSNTSFDVVRVQHNGNPTFYTVIDTTRERELHIGDNTFIEPGVISMRSPIPPTGNFVFLMPMMN